VRLGNRFPGPFLKSTHDFKRIQKAKGSIGTLKIKTGIGGGWFRGKKRLGLKRLEIKGGGKTIAKRKRVTTLLGRNRLKLQKKDQETKKRKKISLENSGERIRSKSKGRKTKKKGSLCPSAKKGW